MKIKIIILTISALLNSQEILYIDDMENGIDSWTHEGDGIMVRENIMNSLFFSMSLDFHNPVFRDDIH
jgi:hypothetical protein